jgi:predicted membrane chloride channel (bestrophin family)
MACSEFNYDDLYGLDLNEYCELIKINIDTLITKNEKELEILKSRLHKLVWVEEEPFDLKRNDMLINCIDKLIKKKEKHLKRLKDWKRKSQKKA